MPITNKNRVLSGDGMEAIIGIIFFITFIEGIFVCLVIDPEDFSFFNPIRNYKKWSSMNWFGVIFFTLLLNIILPVYAFGYWFYKLCTVGRNT